MCFKIKYIVEVLHWKGYYHLAEYSKKTDEYS